MLTLCPIDRSHWERRVAKERKLQNITCAHEKVLLRAAILLESHDNPTHEEIAIAADVSVRTARDALRRGKLLDLIAWENCYRIDPATRLRRQEANRYHWTLPSGPAVPRPDVRRQHRDCAPVSANKLEDSDKAIAYERHVSPASASLAAIRHRMEVRLAERWQAARLFDSG